MKQEISINFVDFWPSFHKKDNYFYHLLSQKYSVKIEEDDPDIVFGSFFNQRKGIMKYENHNSLKIYYTGENDGPQGHPYDACMTQHRIESNNHFRIPLWVFFTSWFGESNFIHHRDPSFLVSWSSLDKSRLDLEAIVDSKSRFCSFIYADLTHERKLWFDVINSFSRVDSAGSCLNNVGGNIQGRGDQVFKLAFLSDYFFSLAIENSCVDGYSTEKLLHPMSTLTIPVYWGDPRLHEDINVDSIIDLRKSSVDVVEELRYLTSSKKAYLDKLEKKWFVQDHTKRYKEDSLLFLESCLLNKKKQS